MEGFVDSGALVRLSSTTQSTLLPSSYYNVASLLRQSFLSQSELCDVILNCIGNRDAAGEGIAETFAGTIKCHSFLLRFFSPFLCDAVAQHRLSDPEAAAANEGVAWILVPADVMEVKFFLEQMYEGIESWMASVSAEVAAMSELSMPVSTAVWAALMIGVESRIILRAKQEVQEDSMLKEYTAAELSGDESLESANFKREILEVMLDDDDEDYKPPSRSARKRRNTSVISKKSSTKASTTPRKRAAPSPTPSEDNVPYDKNRILLLEDPSLTFCTAEPPEGFFDSDIFNVRVGKPVSNITTLSTKELEGTNDDDIVLIAMASSSEGNSPSRFEAVPILVPSMDGWLNDRMADNLSKLMRVCFGISDKRLIDVKQLQLRPAEERQKLANRITSLHGRQRDSIEQFLLRHEQDSLDSERDLAKASFVELRERQTINITLKEDIHATRIDQLMVLTQGARGIFARCLIGGLSGCVPPSKTSNVLSVLLALISRLCGGTDVAEIFRKAPIISLRVEKAVERTNIISACKRLLTEESKQCQKCGKIFDHLNYKTLYHRHVWKHQIDEFECNCGIEFRTFKEKHSHIMQVHQGKEMRECPICKKFLRSKESFETHLRLRHNETKEETVCQICGKMLASSEVADRHFKAAHKVFRCELCGLELIGGWKMRTHKKEVHDAEGPFACAAPGCEMVFKSREKLTNHMEYRHATQEDRRFRCLSCPGVGFVRESQLRKHERNIHRSLDAKCRVEGCGKTYKTIFTRNKHEREKHRGIKCPSSARPKTSKGKRQQQMKAAAATTTVTMADSNAVTQALLQYRPIDLQQHPQQQLIQHQTTQPTVPY